MQRVLAIVLGLVVAVSLVVGALYVRAAPRSALALARRLAGPRRPVVVAGSLFLVGDVLRLVGWRAGERAR